MLMFFLTVGVTGLAHAMMPCLGDFPSTIHSEPVASSSRNVFSISQTAPTTNSDEYLGPMVTHSDDQVVPEAGEPKACTHPGSRITRTPFQQINASGMKGNEVITGMRLQSNNHLVQAVSGRVHEMEDESLEMGKPSTGVPAFDLLYVDPNKVKKQRKKFVAVMSQTGTKRLRPLYEQYIDLIGANGILDGIEKLWPKCHTEAHDLGKVIYAKVQDIGKGLRICADRCHSGCMHGVLMGAFAEAQPTHHHGDHIDLTALKPVINNLCHKNTEMTSLHSPGDCAHGVGHAFMYLTGYSVPQAMKQCADFDAPSMKYYCATGAYMEYVTEHDARDARSKSLLYPCDTSDYPAACLRYKMVHVARRHYSQGKQTEELIRECKNLTGKFRLGCFHGIGNAHVISIGTGRMSIKELCLSGTENEQLVCIEGVIERLAKYRTDMALKVCEDLEGKNKDTCLAAVKNKMYPMDKDFRLYLSD